MLMDQFKQSFMQNYVFSILTIQYEFIKMCHQSSVSQYKSVEVITRSVYFKKQFFIYVPCLVHILHLFQTCCSMIHQFCHFWMFQVHCGRTKDGIHVLLFLQHAAYFCFTQIMSCMHLKKNWYFIGRMDIIST